MAWSDWINPPANCSESSDCSCSETSERGEKGFKQGLYPQSATATHATTATARTAVVELVACRDCVNFIPDRINPHQGIGRCRVNADGDRPPWPASLRRCDRFEITRAGVFRLARAACKSTSVDPSELTDYLIRQNDPDWLTPTAVRRWAEIIDQRGGFPE